MGKASKIEWTDQTFSKPSATHLGLQGTDGPILMERLGKKHAGRMLDNRTWDDFPKVSRRLV